MSDSADDGLSVPVFRNKPTASRPYTTYDLPLYHKPCHYVASVCVCMRVFCNNFCSVCVCARLCSRVYSLLFQLYGCVSFYTQLRLILFIYWSSPLLFNKLLIIISVTVTIIMLLNDAYMYQNA